MAALARRGVRAGQVLDLLEQRGIGERPVLFICHSLGGLLAKQLLRKSADATDPSRQRLAKQTRAVMFLATPHAGAELASLADAFRAVFGTTVSIEDLRAHDAHLRDLFDWYRLHSVELRIQTATYFEQRGVGGVLTIVNPTSSHPGVGADPVGLDEDHLSIAKPRERDALVCGRAVLLLRDHVLVPHAVSPPPAQTPPAAPPQSPAQAILVKLDVSAIGGAVAPRIPHELPPSAEQFFGRATELAQLTQRLRAGKSTAVVGPAGLGKTALAAQAVRAVVGETAATLASSPFADGVLFLDLYTAHGQAEPAWSNLANRLAGVGFMERSSARDRATEACRGRHLLVIIEGGEDADGSDGRATIAELFGVLSSENRFLLLTRVPAQAAPAQSVKLTEALDPDDASRLLDSLVGGSLTPQARADRSQRAGAGRRGAAGPRRRRPPCPRGFSRSQPLSRRWAAPACAARRPLAARSSG